LAQSEEKRFLVETHSDFIIDRFRMKQRAASKKEKVKAQILFFERSSRGNKVNSIEIQEDGSLPEKQPAKYRDFFIREQLHILGI
jgi:predicted ATPase